MLTWHLLSTLTKRIQQGDRKDLLGITPNVDRHATFHAMQTRNIKKHLRNTGTSITPKDGQKYTLSDQVGLWKRHITTIISGACRYLDRLHQAKIVDTDICKHPKCNGQRCDAEQWYYHCHYNTNRNTTGARIEQLLTKINNWKGHGQHRARELRQLLAKPCMRLCGICPDDKPHPTQMGNAKRRRP